MSDKFEHLRKTMEAQVQREIESALYSGTISTATESILDLKKLLPEWEKMARNMRRTQITFVVDLAHPGPPISHDTPNDGTRIELSWTQANALHQEWPLKLLKVLSAEAAEFVPVTVGEFAAKHLPMPPYEMESDDEERAKNPP